MPDVGGGCCRCCCSFIFTLGLTALFMWLSLRASAPKCSLDQFYIPFNETSNPQQKTNISFQVALKNTNKDKGVYYDPVNVAFYDSPNRSHSIGNYTIPKFYQGHKKRARKNGTVAISGPDRVAVARAAGNGSAVFRVDLDTSVRYKIIFWKTKRHKIRVGADVNISGDGSKVHPKGIKLKSNADKIGSYCGKRGVLLVNFWVLMLLILW